MKDFDTSVGYIIQTTIIILFEGNPDDFENILEMHYAH